nr:MAG TPA: hypothetical protein [Caudoviricetes sp.]
MTKTILTGPGVRDYDPPETKVLYWSGACYALVSAIDLYGCKAQPLRGVLLKAHTEAYDRLYADGRRAGASLDCDWDRLTPEQRSWYSLGAADGLTDVLDTTDRMEEIAYDALGLRALARARQAWIDKNHRLGDNYARKVGLLK